ncbi:hypothetical protein [Parasphingorhabdus sp.]
MEKRNNFVSLILRGAVLLEIGAASVSLSAFYHGPLRACDAHDESGAPSPLFV